jgi:hypothetical protein
MTLRAILTAVDTYTEARVAYLTAGAQAHALLTRAEETDLAEDMRAAQLALRETGNLNVIKEQHLSALMRLLSDFIKYGQRTDILDLALSLVDKIAAAKEPPP